MGEEMILFNDKIRPWEEPEFLKILSEVQNNTVIDYIRLSFLWNCVKQVKCLEQGEAAEIGVYKGGSAKLIASEVNSSLYLFDTFEGMPDVNPDFDKHTKGDFNTTSEEEVKEFLKNSPVEVHTIKGKFPDSADICKDKKFKFVHIDVDIYNSTKSCCEFFYERMVTNGLIICDDYGFHTCPGAKKAIDEFFIDKKEYPIYIPTGQCLIIKQ